MVCVDSCAAHSRLPAWSWVGLEVTPDEIRRVVEIKEDGSTLSDMALPDVGCVILALSMALLVIYLMCLWLSRKDRLLQCKCNRQRVCQGVDLRKQVLRKIDAMEERTVALEKVFRCFSRGTSTGRKLEAANSDGSDLYE